MKLPFWRNLSVGVPEAEVRAEIWRLGGRHLGEPLMGARKELAAHDLEPAQARLLRACVDKLRRTQGA